MSGEEALKIAYKSSMLIKMLTCGSFFGGNLVYSYVYYLRTISDTLLNLKHKQQTIMNINITFCLGERFGLRRYCVYLS